MLFEYDCNTFRIGSVSKAVNEKPIFAPKKLKSTKLVTWTQDLFLPYKVTNLLYMSNPEKEYFFVGSMPDVTLDNLYTHLPKNFSGTRLNSPVSSSGGFASFPMSESLQKYRQDTQFRLIFSNVQSSSISLPKDFSTKDDGDVTGLSIVSQGNVQNPKMYFYQKKGANLVRVNPSVNPSNSPFNNPVLSGEPSFNDPAFEYAAIFSDDLENYRCAIGKAARKYSVITSMYNARFTNLLSPSIDLEDVCRPFYAAAQEAIDKINIPLTNDAYDAFAKSSDVSGSVAKLKLLNKAMKTESCPLLY